MLVLAGIGVGVRVMISTADTVAWESSVWLPSLFEKITGLRSMSSVPAASISSCILVFLIGSDISVRLTGWRVGVDVDILFLV